MTDNGRYRLDWIAIFSIMLALNIFIQGVSYDEGIVYHSVKCKLLYMQTYSTGFNMTSNSERWVDLTSFYNVYKENYCSQLFPFDVEHVLILGEENGIK